MEKFVYKKNEYVTALYASIRDFEYKKHCHEEYALGVTIRGIQQYTLDGCLLSSYKDNVMLFNPEQTHDGKSFDKTGIDYVMLYIKPGKLLEILERKELVHFSSPIVNNYELKISIMNLANAIINEKEEALCTEFLLTLIDNISQTDITTVHKDVNVFVTKAKEIILCNLENVLKLDDICKEFGMSKFQFIRVFKSNTGISPYQYFLNCKVEQAKQIIEKNKDIYSAVARCGFVDLAHLNRHFKRIYGATAFEYLSYFN